MNTAVQCSDFAGVLISVEHFVQQVFRKIK